MDEHRRIRQALLDGTERAAERKQALWYAVQQKIEREKQIDMAKKAKRRIRWMVAAAAIAVITAALALTPAGSVLADQFMRLFAPQKQVVTQVEGQQEQQTATLEQNTSQKMGYVIYIDAEHYTKRSEDGVDLIEAKNYPANYPPVVMEISQQTQRSAQDAYAELLREMNETYDNVQDVGPIGDPVDGWCIRAYNDGGGDAAMENVYVVDNTQGGCFIIRCKLFIEAEEGHGARFTGMLETFEVVESGQIQTP